MTKIIYITHDGTETPIEATDGDSLMETAVNNDVPGIDADCGGGCACATCHVYIEDDFVEKLEPAGELEIDMLDFAEDVSTNSRLSCQIVINSDMDGMKVTTPESQH